jgi:hypothetical protein
MIQMLMIVGAFVFLVSVYGAVMVGGHLLEQLARESADFSTRAPGPMTDAPSKSDTQAVAP